VLALFATTQTRTHLIARTAENGMIGEALAAVFQLLEITGTLRVVPGSARVVGDLEQVVLGAPGEAKAGHS
jgi:hypothetical protein